MPKPIVVPLDGSPRAEHALVPVVALARVINCDVHLLHVRAEAAVAVTDHGRLVMARGPGGCRGQGGRSHRFSAGMVSVSAPKPPGPC